MTKDRILGLLSIGMSVIIAIFNFLTVDPTIRMEGDPGPRIFPYMTAAMFGISGFILLIRKQKEPEKIYLNAEQWKRLFRLFAVLCVYIFLIWSIGFNLSTAVLLFTVSTMFAKGKNVPVWQRLVYSVAMTIIIFAIFRYGLRIALPKGLLNLI